MSAIRSIMPTKRRGLQTLVRKSSSTLRPPHLNFRSQISTSRLEGSELEMIKSSVPGIPTPYAEMLADRAEMVIILGPPDGKYISLTENSSGWEKFSATMHLFGWDTLFINKAVVNTMGFSRQEALKGRFTLFLPKNSAMAVGLKIIDLVRWQKPVSHKTISKTKDGREIPISWTGYLIRNDRGQVIAMDAIIKEHAIQLLGTI